MRKVLIATCADRMNGTERYVVDIARKLSKEKFEVAVVTALKGPLSDILKHYNIEEVCIENGIINYYKKPGILNLYRVMKKRRFDVVHANAGIIPCILGKITGAKLSLETKHGLFFTEKQLANLSIKQRMHEKLKEQFVNFTIAISENDKERLIKYLRLNPKKIKVIYNGIDLHLFNSEKITNRFKVGKEIVFACIGRFTYQKAQEILLKAFKEISVNFSNVKLLLVGDGENRQMINDLITDYKMSDVVKTYPYRKDVESLYNEFDVLVMSSRFEGIPYVILESMAYGKPIVSTNVGGISEIILDNKNGFITEVDDVIGLANAMESFINSPDLILKFGEKNKEYIKSFDIMNMVRNYELLYSQNINHQND